MFIKSRSRWGLPSLIDPVVAGLVQMVEGDGGDPPSGGGDPPAGDPPSGGDDYAELKAAIAKERTNNEALQRQLKQLEGMVDPKVYAEAKASAAKLEQRVKEQESFLKLREKEIEDRFSSQLAEQKQRADALESKLDVTERRAKARDVWIDAGGAPGEFEVFWRMSAESKLRRGEDGEFFVAGDDKGTPQLTEDGKRIALTDWVKSLENDPILVHHFEPMGGTGSSSQHQRRAPKTQADLHKLSKDELYANWDEA